MSSWPHAHHHVDTRTHARTCLYFLGGGGGAALDGGELLVAVVELAAAATVVTRAVRAVCVLVVKQIVVSEISPAHVNLSSPPKPQKKKKTRNK